MPFLDDIINIQKSANNVKFGNFPSDYCLLEGAVIIKLTEDVCVQEYLFHRFKEPAFVDYEEGDDIYISDNSGIWIKVEILRIKPCDKDLLSPKKFKKKKNRLKACLKLFHCITSSEDEDFQPFNKVTKVDEKGYEADEEIDQESYKNSFYPLNLHEEEIEINLLEVARDEDYDVKEYVEKMIMKTMKEI
ncbi:hypothetical protein ACKWTF_001012 [Chironomus riparius]